MNSDSILIIYIAKYDLVREVYDECEVDEAHKYWVSFDNHDLGWQIPRLDQLINKHK